MAPAEFPASDFETATLDPRVVRGFRIAARCCALAAGLLGAVGLLGWIYNKPSLMGLWSGGVVMKANTSAILMAAAAAAMCFATAKPRPVLRYVATLLAAVILVVGLSTLAEHASGWDLGIDQLLFREAPGAAATASPNRMGPPAAACFTLAGTALLLLNIRFRKRRCPSQVLALGVGLLPFPSLMGYVYAMEPLYGLKHDGIAAHTSVAFILLGLGILLAQPDRGIMKIVASKGPGGVLARRLLLPAVIVPFLLGWARTIAERTGYVDVSLGRALFILATIIIFTALIWWNANTLNFLNRRVQQASAAAEAANRTKDQFLAVLSHELRTPLTPVMMLVTMLEEDRTIAPLVRDHIATIRRNVQLEVKLIDDLLDLTRVSRGKFTLDLSVVDLHDKIRHVAGICGGDLAAKNLRLELKLEAANALIRADLARIQQVFWNLLKNAIKFTPSGGTITIRTENLTSRIAVAIEDTGIGIAPEVLPRIFEAFEQADPAITRRFGGLGLGLAISKAIVDLHGGTIEAQSAGRNRGSTFRVMLPSAPVLQARDDEGPAALGPAQALAGLRILIVEDNVDTARALARLLHTFGCTVQCADSVAAGLAAAGAARFDLLISDVGLPDGTGHDLLRHLKGKGAMKAIALSGFGMDHDIRKSLDAGFAMHLTKPVDISRLVAAIQKVMQPAAQAVGT